MKPLFECPEVATPISDCSDLIPDWVHHSVDLNRVEAENIMGAQIKYLQGSVSHPMHWFQDTELRAIHRTMLHRVWRWAGTYRNFETSIGIHNTLVPSRLAELCQSGLEDIVKVLVAAGAEVDVKDRSGLTPFQVAVTQENKTLADFLISKGAKRQTLPGVGYMKYYRLYGSLP